ncbi:hypothetical protein C8Q78DRAFT_984030 [Trametes maxima]|nr:hypothetical protein C8Q78DRAFT_984030 [Trametes maxima]
MPLTQAAPLAGSDALSIHPDPPSSLPTSSAVNTSLAGPSQTLDTIIAPYPNFSSYLLGNWFWNASRTKSLRDRDDLVKNVILHEDFVKDDLRGINWSKIDKELAGASNAGLFSAEDGWRSSDVTITVPLGKNSDTFTRSFVVPGLTYRPLEEIVKAVCESKASSRFHYHPFRLLWQPPPHPSGASPPPEEVYGELYSSKAFRDADAELQQSPREPGCNLPRAIVALMPWSDSTHLADFGTASLWPIYMQFGNQSKYERAKPSARACHHAAYIPKASSLHLPDEIQDFIHTFLKKEGIDPLLTHCRRELMHAVWSLLLSDKFVAACRHGIVVKCYDGVTRRLYMRFFTYSADYPEKVLLATVRDMGNCPCPRCLVPKEQIAALGTARDRDIREHKTRVDDHQRRSTVQLARAFILEKGLGVNSVAVEGLLKPQSLVPTLNAFSERLAPDVLSNFHSLFVPDIMHEWELGVWKNLMTHIVRILHAAKGGAVREFNARFRRVPTFGLDIIRRFSSNMAEMKQFAAHDFEDSLQCFISVVDRLLPEPHNGVVLDVVFLSAQLHGMHKLHLHTESTTRLTDATLIEYGKALRRFKRITCAAYNTVELQKESAARIRRQARRRQGSGIGQPPPDAHAMPVPAADGLHTYKLHSLGDYTASIRHIGTLDSYSTKNGELEHRTVKRRFERTSKKNYTTQLANIERREENLQRMTDALGPSLERSESTPFPESDHYHMGKSEKNRIYLSRYLRQHSGDCAIKDFPRKLQTHLLTRIRHNRDATESSFSESERRTLVIEDECIYSHQLLRINYTTYDVRRGQDLINPSTERCNIMLLAHEDKDAATEGTLGSERHLFWYAQVLGIYHANVVDLQDGGPLATPHRMDFLFVRWFGYDSEWRASWSHRRLDQIGFVPDTDPDAFGFVDPNDVIRACHLIPAFAEGRTSRLLGFSNIARPSGESDDWERFYVNRFVDRDMLMRYLGGGVGHRTLAVQLSTASLGLLVETEDDLGIAVSLSTGILDGEENEYSDAEDILEGMGEICV